MKRLPSSIICLLLGFLMLCLPGRSHAAIHLPLDNWPSDMWSVRATGNPSVTKTNLNGHDWLEIQRTSAGPGSAQVFYNGGSFDANGYPVISAENQLGDLKGSVIIAATSWASYPRGIVLRAQGTAFNNSAASLNAYYLAMTGSGLGLYWGVGAKFLSEVAPENILAFDAYSLPIGSINNDPNNQYLLDFSVIGLQFEASVWALDENGEKYGDALATISFFDERNEARTDGFFGLRGGVYGTGTRTYFRELNVEVIPEPSTVAFVAMGLGMSLAFALKRKRQK